MIFIFPADPADEESMGCIAWGKVKGDRNNADGSPVRITEYQTGSERYSFTMNVLSRNLGGYGKKAKWEFEDASVSIFAKAEDPFSRKATDTLKLLRRSDPVIVFGKYRAQEWVDRDGVKRVSHNISADAVIPTAWLYDIMLALFSQIVAKAEPPRARKVKDQPAPKRTKAGDEPKVSHPVVIEDEEWFE